MKLAVEHVGEQSWHRPSVVANTVICPKRQCGWETTDIVGRAGRVRSALTLEPGETLSRYYCALAVVVVALAGAGCSSAVTGRAISVGAEPSPAAEVASNDDHRAQAQQAAQKFVVDINRLGPQSVDQWLSTLRGEVSGQLLTSLSSPTFADSMRKTMAERPFAASAQVRSAAVESSDADGVKVLVSSVLTESHATTATPQVSLSRDRVTVEEHDGKYLVSDMETWLSVQDKSLTPPQSLAPAQGVDLAIRGAASTYVQLGRTFSATTFAADRAKGRELRTPSSQREYDAETKTFEGDVQYGGRSTTATPLAVGVISVAGDRAQVLGFIATTSTFTTGGAGPLQPSTAVIDLVQSNGTWLVAKYTELTTAS